MLGVKVNKDRRQPCWDQQKNVINRHRPSTVANFIHCCRIPLLATALFFGLAAIANAAPGLDTRPVNTSCSVPERPPTNAVVELEQVLSLSFPTSMVQAPNDATRWYVMDRSGFINLYQDGVTFAPLGQFINIQDRVQRELGGRDWGEMGLLGIAFHPDFATNGFVYLYYSADGTEAGWPLEGRVSRFTSLDGGLTLDPTTETEVLRVNRDTQWHWGGQMLFGQDGYLYMSFGDAGRHHNSQDLNSLKGKMLRIDVDNGTPYAIPPDNPYASGGGRGEIYAHGFRNPWRWTFDLDNQEIWLGDVGLNSFEEVNKVVKGGNYGWSVIEGSTCTNLVACNPAPDLENPVFSYAHDPNSAFNAVIGGYVYRGTQLNNLQGIYVYGDNFTGKVFALRSDQSGNPTPELLIESGEFLLSFAQAADGELFVLAENGVYRLINAAGNTGNDNFPQLLSETGCFDANDPSIPTAGLIPYDVTTPLWSDGAAKQRWMALPDGTTVDVDTNGDFEFPIGAVLAKSFRIGGALVETRLFMRHADGGWGGYSYEWNDLQTEATLLPADKSKLVGGQTWFYPSQGQCMQCHTSVAKRALGLEVAQLNKDFTYPSSGLLSNQLETLEHIGIFSVPLPDTPENLPKLAAVSDLTKTPQERARSYLYANCAFCHQPGGPGQGPEDFRYWISDAEIGAINEPPSQSDLGVPDGLLIYPGQPSKSILSLRMHVLDSNRMPPLATSIVDVEGTGAVDEWIRQMNPATTCGAPVYDPSIMAGLYVWEECGSGTWKVRGTAGGTYALMEGEVRSNLPLSFVTPYSIESHDLLDISDPNAIDFILQQWGISEDGFDFGYQPGAGACLEMSEPVTILIGPGATPIQTPVNLETLGACSAPPPEDTVNGRPDFDSATDQGIYLWREADDSWRLNVTAGGTYGDYLGSLDAAEAFTEVVPISIESHDAFDFTSDPSRIEFFLQTWNQGIDGFSFRISSAGATCMDLEGLVQDVIVGADNTVVTTPFDIRTLAACSEEPNPDQGAPSYDPATDVAFFAWRESGDLWRFRQTAGGNYAQYTGSVSSNQDFAVTPFSIETHDTFSNTAANRLDFNLNIWNDGEDGFDVNVGSGASLCVDVDPSTGAEVLVGSMRVAISGPTDLITMTTCTP